MDIEEAHDWWEERTALLMYEAGLSQEEAERYAYRLVLNEGYRGTLMELREWNMTKSKS